MKDKEKMSLIQERLIVFFDAVLAIAITMMALEISVPLVDKLNSNTLWEIFENITMYLISFLALGEIWIIHSNFFCNYKYAGSRNIIYLNLILLFIVTLFPFATRFMINYSDIIIAKIFYLLTFLLMQLFMLVLMLKTKQEDNILKKNQNKIIEKIITESNSIDEKKKIKSIELMQTINTYMQCKDFPDILIKESIDENYYSLLEEENRQKNINFKYSIFSMLVAFIAITFSVIGLMFSPFISYIPLLLGLVINLFGKIYVYLFFKRINADFNNNSKL